MIDASPEKNTQSDHKADSAESKTLGFLLADATRLMRRIFAKRLENEDFTLGELKTLISVARFPGIRQVDLADRLEIQPISLARMVDQLAGAGLVERRQHPTDRRAFQLFVTEKAEPRVSSFRKEAADFQMLATQGLSPEQIDTFLFCLNKVHENISTLLINEKLANAATRQRSEELVS